MRSLSSWRSSNQTTFFCLPFLKFPLHPFNYICLRAGLSKGINEISVRIHEIEKYGVVDEVVVIWFGTGGVEKYTRYALHVALVVA
jgi:hypothetical protein